jgi:heme iron utilization protein
MSEISRQTLNDFIERYRQLLLSQQTLLLSTASVNGVPNISYAPFVRDCGGCFYIYISQLAGHTANLLDNPRASIMIVRPESESRNLFARERAVFNCSAKEITRGTENYKRQIQALQDKFGQVVGVLSALSDFHLFALLPESGRYVAGFSQAFTINVGDDSLDR